MEKENGWPHPPTADGKTRSCSNVLGARGPGRTRHGEAPSKKTWKRWVLAGMEPTGSPVTVRDGDLLSPGGPRGTVGPKSK